MAASKGQGSTVASVTLHQRILSEIEHNILSGKWVPGYRILSEHELALHYQCSRMTVSKVLTQLAQAHMVERKRKAGTVVLRSQSRSAVLEVRGIRAEVMALNLPYRYEILKLKKRRSQRADMKALELDAAGPIVEATVLHFAGTRPFCYEYRLINLQTVPSAAVEDFSDEPPGTWLMAHVPWTSAEHRIRASAVGQELAAILQVGATTPCLIVERSTWAQEGKSVTFVSMLYPGDGHELVARFSPTQTASATANVSAAF